MPDNNLFVQWLIYNYKDIDNKIGDLVRDYIDDKKINKCHIKTYIGLRKRIKKFNCNLEVLNALDEAYNIYKNL